MNTNSIKKEIKKIVFRYLNPNTNRVYIFGSFATGKVFRGSDIDIGIESKKTVDLATLSELKSAFENSPIPYTVDVVDFHRVSAEFKNYALKNIIPLH